MTALKGLLFDKDGTLLDFHASWNPVYERLALSLAGRDTALAKRLLEAGGFNHATRRFASGSLLAVASTHEIAEVWAKLLPTQDIKALVETLDHAFAAEGPVSSEAVMPLGPFFQRLKGRGLKVGVATSDNERAAKAILKRFDALQHLDFLAGYDSGHGIKPHPGMIEGFCRSVSLVPNEIAMIGDNLHDLEMGRRAGVAWRIGVLTGTSARSDLAPHADLVLDSIAELEAWLDRQNAA